MGRLIDEDELVEEIKSLKIVLDGKDIFPAAAKDTVLRIISEQPTACDPEKVVAELEEHFNATNDKGARLAYHHAIQIVKGGGVDV